MNKLSKLAYSLFGVTLLVFCVLALYCALQFSYETAFQGNLYGVNAIQYALDAFLLMVLLVATFYVWKLAVLVVSFIFFVWSSKF